VLDLSWQEAAACKERPTADFYLDADDYPEIIQELRQLCEACPVLPQCQIYALTWESYGFWGNTTVSERRRLRKQFGIAKRQIRNAHLSLVEGGKGEPKNNLEKARAMGKPR
jgi:Transcription factor WhiB